MTNQYNRYFINLYQEDSNCVLKGKQAIGRCKVETKSGKGQLSIWAQNLKQDAYDIFLINSDSDHCNYIIVGQLVIDNRGYGELNLNFNPDNILDSNINIENVNVVAVTPKNKKYIVTMCGYRNSKILWRDKFNIDSVRTKKIDEPKKVESPKIKSVPKVENETSKSKMADEKQIQMASETDSFKELAQRINKELEKLKSYSFITEEELMNLSPKHKPIDSIFENNMVMTPFEKCEKDMDWVKLTMRELANLPIDFWLYANNPTLLCAYYQNKHFIFGRNKVKDEYILGLPCKYNSNDEEDLKKLGFKQFKPCKDKKASNNDSGYWLMDVSV